LIKLHQFDSNRVQITDMEPLEKLNYFDKIDLEQR